jgi:hypothetical protein
MQTEDSSDPSTELKRLTFPHGQDVFMDWPADGEHIAFTSSRMGLKDASGRVRNWLMRAAC